VNAAAKTAAAKTVASKLPSAAPSPSAPGTPDNTTGSPGFAQPPKHPSGFTG
jgi:hypothetical protein